MFKLMRYCAVLALFPFLVACSDDSAPGVSIAGESSISQSQNGQPSYYKAALARATQLSTSPGILVAICESDAKAQGHTSKSLANYVYQCVENAGME